MSFDLCGHHVLTEFLLLYGKIIKSSCFLELQLQPKQWHSADVLSLKY